MKTLKIPKAGAQESQNGCAAFTLTELLVIIAVIALLFCLRVSAHTGLKDQTRIAQCSGNLKQLNLAFQIYGGENNDRVPPGNSGNWAWDLPWAAGNTLSQWIPPKQFYCPGTGDRFSTRDNSNLWNYAVNSFHVIGYAMTLPGGNILNITNLNGTLTPKRISGAPAILPPPSPSQRVLVADATISAAGEYTFALRSTYNYTDIAGGYALEHLSPHLNGATPAGGDVGMLDGHVEWRKFDSMQCRTVAGTGTPGFWW